MGKRRYIFSLVGVLFMANASSAKEHTPIIIAHRGASGYLPEHTLISAAMAYGMGADFLEPDLVLTQDGVPIVLHDILLDYTTDVAKRFPNKRRTDGHFYAIDFILEEIKELRVNERVSSPGKPVFPKRFPMGLSRFEIPTFGELIELLIGLNTSTGKNIGLYPEIKEPEFHLKHGKDLAKIVHEMLKKYKLGNAPLYWQCFHAETLKRFKTDFASKYPRILLIEDGDLDLENPDKMDQQLAEIAKYSDGIGPSLSHVFNTHGNSTGLVKLAHKHKLLVHAYTLRSDKMPAHADSWNAFLEKVIHEEKIDGVFTDFTDKLVRFLGRDPFHAH